MDVRDVESDSIFLQAYWPHRVSRRKGSIVGRLLFLIVTGFITINVLMTYFVTLASIQNYPGGQALALLHDLDPQGYPYRMCFSTYSQKVLKSNI